LLITSLQVFISAYERFSLFSLAFVVVAVVVVVVFAFPKRARHFEFQIYGGA